MQAMCLTEAFPLWFTYLADRDESIIYTCSYMYLDPYVIILAGHSYTYRQPHHNKLDDVIGIEETEDLKASLI